MKSNISIITVVKNDENNIIKTIKSTLNQKKCQFEYIVCDGDSKDLTSKKIINYKKKNSKKFIYIRSKDKNLYDGINKAIKKAKGEYIFLLQHKTVQSFIRNIVKLLRILVSIFLQSLNMLEYKKIPYRMIMGMPPSKGEFQNKISKHLVNSPYTKVIKNFIGWPLFEPLEGFCCADMIEGEFINSTNIHPNARGQQLMTDEIWESL